MHETCGLIRQTMTAPGACLGPTGGHHRMKKLLVGLMMATLVSLGFVGSTTTSASAVDCNVYPGCVVGKLRVNKANKIRFNKTQTIRVRITTPGNRVPTGTINLLVKRKGGQFAQKFKARPYTGQPLIYKTDKLKVPGRYKIIATFTANAPFADLRNAKKSFVVKEKGFR
jgi:hypothetical protein